MKINFQMSGGFAYIPALSKPSIIDTSQVDPDTAKDLEARVRDSRFFEQPARASAAPKGADYRTYTITIEDGGRSHTIQLTDPIKDSNLQTLVSQLRTISNPTNR
jgi:hypothetical protein